MAKIRVDYGFLCADITLDNLTVPRLPEGYYFRLFVMAPASGFMPEQRAVGVAQKGRGCIPLKHTVVKVNGDIQEAMLSSKQLLEERMLKTGLL